jgi:malonyl-CoA/methylmalonyl-CoA synthetase
MDSGIPLMDRAADHTTRTALIASDRSYTYGDLLAASGRVARTLLNGLQTLDLEEARVAYLVPGSFEYVAIQWGIWRAGGMAVPLNSSAADPEIEYVLANAEVGVVIVAPEHAERMAALCNGLDLPLLSVEGVMGTGEVDEEVRFPPLPTLGPSRAAMMLYTSGTTSKPKGVVSTHGNIQAQVLALVEAWGWEADDRIPLFLPLHHIHGIVNVLSCALWSGAQVEAFSSFDLPMILDRVGEGAYTVFMAVPTIYVKMIRALHGAPEEERRRWAGGFGAMRLMVSGSAALPASIHEEWTRLTGQKLLERYGMTEIGMGLSNPFLGERRPGAVGQPLPGVEVRLVTEDGSVIPGEGTPGEIQVRGPAVFAEYWRRPDATRESFVDGWFRTGDMAVVEDGYFRILGRLSVDIIKSGGEKLSALEIEEVLREHPRVREVAVVGVDDDVWGESVAAAVVTEGSGPLELDAVRAWARGRVAPAKLPRKLLVVEDLPRNAMGKVRKPGVKALFRKV